MIYAVEYTVGFGYFGILSNLSADSIQIDVNSNRILGYVDATNEARNDWQLLRCPEGW